MQGHNAVTLTGVICGGAGLVAGLLIGRSSGGFSVARRPRVVVAVATAVVFGWCGYRFGPTWTLPAYLWLAAMGILLTIVDLREHRLPNRLVVATAGGGGLLLAAASAGGAGWPAFGRAIVGGTTLLVLYLVLALAAPAGLGMGDVKLAGVVGLFTGFLGWRAMLWAGAGAFVLIAAVSLALLAARRVHRGGELAFGPAMLASAMLVVLIPLS